MCYPNNYKTSSLTLADIAELGGFEGDVGVEFLGDLAGVDVEVRVDFVGVVALTGFLGAG